MKPECIIFLFLPSILYGFSKCCFEGEVLDVLNSPTGSSPPCVANERSTVIKNQLLVGLKSSSVKYPAGCSEFEHFEVKSSLSFELN